ncbi:MAG: TPM domain-containing protein [Bacteroidota bacterium]
MKFLMVDSKIQATSFVSEENFSEIFLTHHSSRSTKLQWKYAILVPLMLLLLQVAGAQKAIPPKSFQLVNDYARVLQSSEKRALERKLVAYNDSTSTQIAVVIDNSLQGEDIFDYSYRLAESWGIGQGEKNNGILIYVAFNDRKLWIQTGYGAEGFLPDAMAQQIIDGIITPAFKQQQYYRGLDRATDVIIKLAQGEYTADDIRRSNEDSIFPIIMVFLIIFLIFYLASRGGGGNDDDDGGYYRGGRYQRRRGGGGWVIMPGSGSWDIGGGGGGGFGGGGFGGFGGGSFGGGGAGGSW